MLSTALKIVFGSLGIAVVVILSWCASHNVWSRLDYYNYSAMCEWNHPMLLALREGHIREGSPSGDLAAVCAPEWKEDYGRLVYYHYTPRMSFDVVRLSTVDGKVTSADAGSCTWHWMFFHDVPEGLGLAAKEVDFVRDKVECNPADATVLRPILEAACNKLQMPVPELGATPVAEAAESMSQRTSNEPTSDQGK